MVGDSAAQASAMPAAAGGDVPSTIAKGPASNTSRLSPWHALYGMHKVSWSLHALPSKALKYSQVPSQSTTAVAVLRVQYVQL